MKVMMCMDRDEYRMEMRDHVGQLETGCFIS